MTMTDSELVNLLRISDEPLPNVAASRIERLVHELSTVQDHSLARLQVGPDGHVPGNTVEALIAWHKEAGRLREEWVRAKRMLVIIAKQSRGDEGAIPGMVVNAIGEAEYDRLYDEITDDEVRGLAYPYG